MCAGPVFAFRVLEFGLGQVRANYRQPCSFRFEIQKRLSPGRPAVETARTASDPQRHDAQGIERRISMAGVASGIVRS